MAKFCTKCGKKLEDGQVCDCEKGKKEKVEVVTTSAGSGTDIKESFMDCVNVFKKIFTKPIDAIKEFVTENKLVSGIIMIIVAALSTGLYKIATLKNMYEATSPDSFNMSDFSDLLSNALSGNLGSAQPDYFKEFLTTSLTNLAEYALIALIGYFVITAIFKGKAVWKNIVVAVGISLSVVLAANLINSVLVFIDGEVIGYIRGYVTSFASILSMLILYKSLKEVVEVDKNKLFAVVASMSVFATVVIDIANKIFD